MASHKISSNAEKLPPVEDMYDFSGPRLPGARQQHKNQALVSARAAMKARFEKLEPSPDVKYFSDRPNMKLRKKSKKNSVEKAKRESHGTHIHKITTSDKAAKRRLKKKVRLRYEDLEFEQGHLTFKQISARDKELKAIDRKTPVDTMRISTKDPRDTSYLKEKKIAKQRRIQSEKALLHNLEQDDPAEAAGNRLHQNLTKIRKKKAKDQRQSHARRTKLRTKIGAESSHDDDAKISGLPNISHSMSVSPVQALTSFLESDKVKKAIASAPFLGNVVCFLFQLGEAHTHGAYLAASYQFSSIVAHKVNIVDLVMSFVNTIIKLIPKRPEALSDHFDHARYFYDSIMGSSMLQTLREFILRIVSLNLFNKDFSVQVSTLLGKVEPLSLSQFVPYILGTLAKFARFAESLAAGMPCSELLLNPDPITTAIKNAHIQMQWNDLLYTGLKVPGKRCARYHATQIKPLSEFLEKSLKVIPRYSPKYRTVHEVVTKLNLSYNTVSNMLLGKTRDMPFAVIVHGPPGVGKSKIVRAICEFWSDVKGRKFDMSHVYTRVVTSQYISGYDPLSHPIMRYPELGGKSENLTKSQGDNVVMELTSLIDSLPLPLDMAAVEKKGKVWAIPELVVVDTNNPSLDLDNLVTNPAAIRRRFAYVGVSVKDKYCKDGTIAMDVGKSLGDKDNPNTMDRWLFEVKTSTAINNVQSDWEAHMMYKPNEDIYKLKDVMTKMMTEHLQNCEYSRKVDEESDVFATRPESFADNLYDGWQRYVHYLAHCNTQLYWLLERIHFKYVEPSWYLGFYVGVYMTLQVANIFTDRFIGYGKSYAKKKCSFWWGILRSNEGPDDPFPLSEILYTPEPWIAICVTLATLYRYYSIYNRYRAPEKVEKRSAMFDCSSCDESESEEEEQPVPKKMAESILDKYDCTSVSTRIPIKGSSVWNAIAPFPVHDKCLNDKTQVLNRVQSNVRKVRIEPKGKDRGLTTHVLGVRGAVALVTRHSFSPTPENLWTVKVPISTNNDPTQYTVDTLVRTCDMYKVCSDVVLVQLNGVQFKDIVDYFAPALCAREMSVLGQIEKEVVRVRLIEEDILVEDKMHGIYAISPSYAYEWSTHNVGECGKPLYLAKGGGTSIGGIHVAGEYESAMSYSAAFTRAELERALEEFRQKVKFMPIVSEACLDFVFEPPGTRSPFRYEKLDGIRYFGKLPGKVMIKQKSRVRTTRFSNHIEEIFDHSMHDDENKWKYGAPPMQPFTRDGIYLSPWNICLRSMSRSRPALDPTILEKCVDLLVDRILATCTKSLRPLSVKAAVNGIESDPLYRRINATTSAGFGFSGKKKDHLPVTYQDMEKLIREPTEDLKNVLEETLKIFDSGKCPPVVFKAHLKDEPRERRKNIIGKTRVFFAGPVDNLILNKMFLSPFYTLMMEFSSVFCTAIGVDMHADPGRVVDALFRHSINIMEGDYGAYDQSQLFAMKLASFTVVYRVLSARGYNESALRVVQALLSQNLFPHVLMNLDLFSVSGFQPSGKYGTAEDNSLYGLLSLMYAWYYTSEEDFFKHVVPVTYGDDMGASVSSSHKWFNAKFYAKFCAEHYGMKFTTTSKQAATEAFVDKESFSFLKRTFKHSDVLNRTVAPLALDSILRALILWIPSKHVSEEEQMISVVSSMMREYFFHCDSDIKYTTVRDSLIALTNEKFLVPTGELQLVIPTWDQLVETFTNEPVS